MPNFIFFSFALSLLLSASLSGQTSSAIETTKLDVVYKTVESRSLKLDLHYPSSPKSNSRFPLVLFTHGGGWAAGSKTIGERGLRYLGVNALNEKGFCVASVQYRLCKKDSGITMRDCVTDAKDALRFLAKNAEKFSIDPNRVFTFGDSAGGHLAQMVLLSPTDTFPGDPKLAGASYRMVAGVSWYGPSDFERMELFNGPGKTGIPTDRFRSRIVNGIVTHDEKLAAYREVSPVNYLHSDSPPLLMMQGDLDTTIPVHHAHHIHLRAEKLNAHVDIYIVKNCIHNWRTPQKKAHPDLDKIIEKTAEFLSQHLEN